MKVKSHSGLKKRLKVRKSGMVTFDKPARRHLLINKSKRQKKAMHSGVPVASGSMKHARRLMSSRVKIHTTRQQRAAKEKAEGKKEVK